jgi:hypothetical protein
LSILKKNDIVILLVLFSKITMEHTIKVNIDGKSVEAKLILPERYGGLEIKQLGTTEMVSKVDFSDFPIEARAHFHMCLFKVGSIYHLAHTENPNEISNILKEYNQHNVLVGSCPATDIMSLINKCKKYSSFQGGTNWYFFSEKNLSRVLFYMWRVGKIFMENWKGNPSTEVSSSTMPSGSS